MALRGINVVEMAGLAPAPLCGMILADFGARVIRVDRTKNLTDADKLARGKLSIAVDLKKREGVEVVHRLCKTADVLIEPFRKGVMEKLGLGPDKLLAANPGLVYARLTGYGQSGPLSSKAGHDINYISIAGVLSQLGRQGEKPYAPVNLVADFGGGSLVCALGILMALLERGRSGQGQVVDAAMTEGAAYLSSFLWRSRDLSFLWGRPRGENLLDGGAAFYDTYCTKDGKFMSVGALEPQFYNALLEGLGLDETQYHQFVDPAVLRRKFEEVFASKTQEEWVQVFETLDACVTPVLEMGEAACHPHNKACSSFLPSPSGRMEPAPAPRLSRTPATDHILPQPAIGQHTRVLLEEAGYAADQIQKLLDEGVVEQAVTQAKL